MEKKKVIVWGIGLGAAAVLVGTVLFFTRLPQGWRQAGASYDALKKAGMGDTVEEYAALFGDKLPTVSALLRTDLLNAKEASDLREEFVARHNAQRWLRDWEKLDTLRESLAEASEAPSLVIVKPGDTGLDTLSLSMGLRQGVQLLAKEAVAKALTGDKAGAMASFHQAKALARRSGDAPLAIWCLIHAGLSSSLASSLHAMGAARPDDSAWLAELVKEAAALPPPRSLDRPIMGEAMFVMGTSADGAKLLRKALGGNDEMAALENGAELEPIPFVKSGTLLPRSGIARALIGMGLGFYEEAVAAARSESLSTREIAERLERAQKQWLEKSGIASRITEEMLSGPGYVVQARLNIETWSSLSLASLKILQWRKAEGRWPSRLEEVAGLPANPITGRPFSYKQKPGGFVLAADQSSNPGAPQWEITHPPAPKNSFPFGKAGPTPLGAPGPPSQNP